VSKSLKKLPNPPEFELPPRVEVLPLLLPPPPLKNPFRSFPPSLERKPEIPDRKLSSELPDDEEDDGRLVVDFVVNEPKKLESPPLPPP
jgi:hypothetical protein